MDSHYPVFLLLFLYPYLLKADTSIKEPINVDIMLSETGTCYISPFPQECSKILDDYAEYAANFTKCSILHARPIRICERCIDHYLSFHKKYQDLLTTVVNGTSCKSIFVSCDRLDAILEYHDNIMSIWDKGHCYACYNWTTDEPVLSNETTHFNELFIGTMNCIKKYNNSDSNNTKVCDNCMQSYLKLDNYYKTLSADAIGVDSICMDIVDSMNATRSIWSKSLNCCRIRKTPEVIFLVCTGIISVLPLLYYLVLRYFSPIRDLPNVLKRKYLTHLGEVNVLSPSQDSSRPFCDHLEDQIKGCVLKKVSL